MASHDALHLEASVFENKGQGFSGEEEVMCPVNVAGIGSQRPKSVRDLADQPSTWLQGGSDSAQQINLAVARHVLQNVDKSYRVELSRTAQQIRKNVRDSDSLHGQTLLVREIDLTWIGVDSLCCVSGLHKRIQQKSGPTANVKDACGSRRKVLQERLIGTSHACVIGIAELMKSSVVEGVIEHV